MSDAGNTNLGWEAVKGFLGKLLQGLFGFVGTIVFARILGPTSFGGYYLLFTYVILVDRPIRGVGRAVKKRYSEADARKEEIVGGVLVFNTIFVVLVGIPVFVLGERLHAATHVENAPLVFMSLLASLAIFFPLQKMLPAEGHVAIQTWNDTLRSVLTLPLQIGFVLLGFNAAGMGYGLAAATILTVPTALWVLRPGIAVPSRDTFRSLWQFARYSIPDAFVSKIYDRFDVLLLGAVISTAAVGQYEAAIKLTVPAVFLSSVVTAGLMPKVSNQVTKGESPARDINNALSYISILAIPIFFGTLAVPNLLVVTAYGSEYAEAAPFLIGLTLFKVVSTQSGVYNQVISGVDRPDLNFKIGVVTLLFNILLGVVLVYTIGAIGVVIATVLAGVLQYLVSMTVVRKSIAGIRSLQRPVFFQIGAGLAMFLGLEVLTARYTPTTWWEVLIIVLVGAAIYGFVLFGTSASHRKTVYNILRDGGVY